mgnify:CR=1 FL=1
MKIDIQELAMVLEDNSAEVSYYFDRETGEVIPIMINFGMDASDEDEEEINDNPDRYIFIEPLDSRTGYRIMEDFVTNLPDGPAKELLERALSWKKPFSNFKSALLEFPELKEPWFKHHDARLEEIVRQWLEAHEIDIND